MLLRSVVIALLLLLPGVLARAPNDTPVDASCVQHELSVLLDDVHGPQRLVAWLCGASGAAGQTVIIVSPTGLSDHAYWDFPYEPETYSYVRDAVAAGYAVLNYDRIGTGLSARPPAAAVTVESEAYVVHQLTQKLRVGDIGGQSFAKVVHMGNSLSTFIGIMTAEIYGDLDGLVNTGVFVGPTPVGLATLFAAFYPAQFDPKFAQKDIPLGYATTQPGSRSAFFHLPTADPAVVALDEDLKETATLGEAASFPHWWAATRLVDVPVLSVMGSHDILFCSPECAQDGLEATRERLFWGPETCLEIEILPETGHFIQLQTGATDAYADLTLDWLDRRIGNNGTPASQPCDA